MSTPTPRVSVCIPTYKGAQTIGPAIASVLAQTFCDFELLVIDDCSPDATADVVAGFNDPRLRYLRNASNLGPEGNWNRCLDEARGLYFKLLPHDDLLAPRCLEREVAVLDADAQHQTALVFCARDIIGPDGRLLAQRGYPGASEGGIQSSRVTHDCVSRGTNLLGEPGGVLMRRTLAANVGPFDASNPYVIDLDYWFRALRFGAAYYCAESLVSFRVSSSQWSFAIGKAQGTDFMNFVRRVRGTMQPPLGVVGLWRAWIAAQRNALLRLVFYKLFL